MTSSWQVQGQTASLRPHEQAALDLVFSQKGQMLTSVKLSDLQNRLTSRMGDFNKPLEQEMQEMGLLDPAWRQVKRTLGIAAAVLFGLLIIGFGVGILIAVNTGLWPSSPAADSHLHRGFGALHRRGRLLTPV